MANRNLSPLSVPDYDPKAQPVGSLPSGVQENAGLAASTMASIAERLSSKMGAMADRSAQIEGKRTGEEAGLDPAFRPTGSTTLKGFAQDEAAINVYSSGLVARMQSDMADLFAANRDNPVGYAAGSKALQAKYLKDHVFPSVAADFNNAFAHTQLGYRTKIDENFDKTQKDQAQAALVGDLSKSSSARGQYIVANQDPLAVETYVKSSLADDDRRLDQLVAGKQMSAEEAAKQKDRIHSRAAIDILVIQANRLKTPDDIEALRQKMKVDFGAGKITGLDADSYQQLDSEFQRLASSRRTTDNVQENALQKQFDDIVKRVGKGESPSSGEWVGLAIQAGNLGPKGAVMLENARRREGIAHAIAGLPPDQADAYVSRLEAETRTGGNRGAIIRREAAALGIDPTAYATAISYETAQSWSTGQPAGGVGGRFGVIQFGKDEAKEFGAFAGQDFDQQMQAATRYLKKRGLKPGASLEDIYSTINAGSPGHPEFRDASGKSVAEHVAIMSTANRADAEGVLGAGGTAPALPFEASTGAAEEHGRAGSVIVVNKGADLSDLSESGRGMLKGMTEDNLPVPIKVVAGYAEHGHVKHSQHAEGNAIDLRLVDENGNPFSDEQKAAVLESAIRHGARGIGIYPSGTAMHIDTRQTPTYWSEGSVSAGYAGKNINTAPAWAQPGLQALFKGQPPPQVAERGMSGDVADDIDFARKLVKEKHTAYADDMLGAAQSEGSLPGGEITPFDPSSPDAVVQLGARIAQTDGVAKERGLEPKYLRPAEKVALSALLARGDDQSLVALRGIVAAAGDRAPVILKQVGEDSPVMAQIGGNLAAGGSPAAARDAMAGIKIKHDGGTLAPLPKTSFTLAGNVIGQALADNPEEAARIVQTAEFIYGARMVKNHTDPTSSEGEAVYKRALIEAAGGTVGNRGEAQAGGFMDWPPGYWSGKTKGTIYLPPGMRPGDVEPAIESIRDADLAAMPFPPVDRDGKPQPARNIHQALPVRWKGADGVDGFRFKLLDPQTGDTKWIAGSNGRQFFLPFTTLGAIARSRLAMDATP